MSRTRTSRPPFGSSPVLPVPPPHDVAGPEIECGALLRSIGAAIVDSSSSAFVSANMVKHGLEEGPEISMCPYLHSTHGWRSCALSFIERVKNHKICSPDEEGRPRRCRRSRPASRPADGEPTNGRLLCRRHRVCELVHTSSH